MQEGKQAEQHRRDIKAPFCKPQQRDRHRLVNIERHAVFVEFQVVPRRSEDAGGERASGDASDPVEAVEQPDLIEPNQASQVKQHRAEPPAGEAQANPIFQFVSAEEIFRGCPRPISSNDAVAVSFMPHLYDVKKGHGRMDRAVLVSTKLWSRPVNIEAGAKSNPLAFLPVTKCRVVALCCIIECRLWALVQL